MVQVDKTTLRVRYLMLTRVGILTFLLGIVTFVDIKAEELLPEISVVSFYTIVIASYILSILYYALLHFLPNLKVNLYIQAICDVLLVTGLVYATGGIQSIYAVFYSIIIIYAVIFLGRQGGLLTASACSIFYGGLLDLQYYAIVIPLHSAAQDLGFGAGYVLIRIVIYIFSFFFIALLASFVVEQEIKTRTLLEEKTTAFDQLDILHHSIIESVDAGIMTIDLRGRIKSFNKAAEEITGYLFADVENRSVPDIFPEYASLYEKFNQWPDQHSGKRRIEMNLNSRSGQHLILGCSLSSLKDSKGKRIGDILVFQDLTEKKRMEAHLETSRRLAFVGEMAAGLAHEMRNPLASISGSIQMLRKGLNLNSSDERLMQIILRGKDQLENFMKDFLLLSRPTPGVHETLMVDEIMDDVLEAVTYIPDWREHIEITRTSDGCPEIFASRTEIRQLIWNLVLNAVQATQDEGRITIATRRAMMDASIPALEIIISDNGSGIAGEDIEKIFDPFFTTKEKGTGLGLAIVRRIVESYVGVIDVQSVPGQGTTFMIQLPCKT